MALTVRELLALPVLDRARPEVVTGTAGQLDRTVRWVHTSEIYDISPLLKGGEVLLTTGLGLVAAGDEAVERYVASLARTGVVALCLELGRTFASPPASLVAAARREGLVVVTLHGVVPFIEVTEAVYPLLAETAADDLRAGVDAADDLVAGMLAGDGLPGLVARVAAVVGLDVAVVSLAGDVLAGTGGALSGWNSGAASVEVAITHGNVTWATLVVGGELTALRRTVVDRVLPLLALELQRTTTGGRSRDEAGAELLADIVAGRYASAAEIARRAAGLGIVVGPGQRAAALCVVGRGGRPTPPAAVAAARTAARRVVGSALVTADDGGVVVGVVMTPRELRGAVRAFTDVVRAELAATESGRFVVSAGPFVDDLAGLGRSVPAARDTALLARRLTPEAELAFTDDYALYQLLAGLVDDEALERFVRDQIGALLDHDARRGTELVRTLDAYLANSQSKTATAAALGVRRQTLYGRLERIGALLGATGLLEAGDVAHRERRTALDLALVSWRLRNAAAART